MSPAIAAGERPGFGTTPRPRATRKRFRLSTMLWFYALLAAAMATFTSIEEYVCASALLWGWLTLIGRVGAGTRWSFARRGLLACLPILVFLSASCYPILAETREVERVDECRNKMERIAQALLEYQAKHGNFPQTEVVGSENSRLSWRAVVIPYLAAAEEQATLATGSKGCEELNYCCPSHAFSGAGFGSSASYFAVTGAGTAWDALQSKRGTFRDDPAQTILLLEELGRGFHWEDPRDLDFEEALRLLTQPVGSRYVHLSPGKPGYFEKPNPNRGAEGVNAAFADGSVRFIPLPLTKEFATALLTADGGEAISAAEMKRLWRAEPDWGKVYSLVLVVAIGLLPGLRLLKQPARLLPLVGDWFFGLRRRLGDALGRLPVGRRDRALTAEAR